jgi:hypothetical protein
MRHRWFTWRFQFLGFGIGLQPKALWAASASHTIWTVPYWFIVLPLTMLSAWLLLSKRPVFKTAEPPKDQS